MSFLKELLIFVCLTLSVSANRGPIGYQLFRNIERISELRTGVHTKQFSSFDRKGTNDDSGPFACSLRKIEGGRCLLAEVLGSGEINSIWTTRDNGVVNKTGKIVIELDGIIIVDHQLQVPLLKINKT